MPRPEQLQYGFGHALRSRTDEETDVLHFPEPLVIYLYQDKELPPFRELTIDFGDQGSFRYRVTAINYLSMPLEELNRRKLIVLIPFQLLKLRKEIEKKRTPENLDALKKLINIDIIEHEHKMEMRKLEQKLKQELSKRDEELNRKDKELSNKDKERDDVLRNIVANLRRDGKTESEILQIMGLKKEELDTLEASRPASY